jgi:hypothetical protein
MILLKPGGPEDGYAWSDKVEGPEAAHQLEKDLHGSRQIKSTPLRPLKKLLYLPLRFAVAPR